jgi:hypothetical protein
VLCFGLSLLGFGCEEKKLPPDEPTESAEASGDETKKTPTPTPPTSERFSLLRSQASCTLWHKGLVLDMGSEAIDSRRMFSLKDPAPLEVRNRVGEDFRHFEQVSTDLVFWLTEPMAEFEIAARVFGSGSERIAFLVDGKRLGSAALKTDEISEVAISAQDTILEKGRHQLTISLSRPRGASPSADVSWVRIGSRARPAPAPSTVKETFTEVTIGDERIRSIVLRPGARLLCPVRIPPRAELVTQLGIWGEGAAEAEVAVHTEEGQRIVVATSERDAEDPRDYAPLQADLSPFASQFVDLELYAPRGLQRSQIVFGDPEIVSPAQEEEKPVTAKRAILVLLSGLGTQHVPPSSAETGLPLLNQLAQSATLFPQYRASTTSVPGVIASLFTGLPPWVHGVDRERDSLPAKMLTLASAIEAQGGRTSFFTGVPLSAAPFGFDRGFAKFDSIYPQEDEAATEPLSRAVKWLGAHLDHPGPVLSVVHLRGGHPPFDVTPEAAVDLAPKEYGGDLTPRRAAIQLAEIRGRSLGHNRQMPAEDWKRLFALQKAALLKQNAELGSLVAWLRKREAFDDTLLIVMGDVGAGEPPTIPFSSQAPLTEEALTVPLLIKFPHGHRAGERVEGWFAPHDISRTVSEVLHLEKDFGELDMSRKAATVSALVRPHIAYRAGHYSLLFDSFLLIGEDQKAPKLCMPSIDPTCQQERSTDQILAARALWLSAWNILHDPLMAQEPRAEEPEDEEPKAGSPEQAFENALIVWGVDR